MRSPQQFVVGLLALTVSMAGVGPLAGAEPPVNASAGTGSLSAQAQQQPPTVPSGQPQDDRALEIAPQLGSHPDAEPPAEIQPAEPSSPPENAGAPDRGFGDQEHQAKIESPYLGIAVEYTLKCYMGQEEHGLEIVSVDSGSPAEKAGLKGRGSITAVGAAGVTAGALLGPLVIAVLPLLQKTGQLGKDGDLIVAVDDHRVRSEFDLQDELTRLKPGDTLYVTVIRPSSSGHETVKLAVTLGHSSQATVQTGFNPYSQQSAY